VWPGLGASNAMRRGQAILAHHLSHPTVSCRPTGVSGDR
jgi:hypothetical protein